VSLSHQRLLKAGLPALLGVLLLSFIVNAAFFSRQQAYAASAVTINGGTTYQTIDGFGFSEAFGQGSNVESAPASAQQQALNDLFSTSTGAGFTILRNLLPSDSGGTIEPNNPGSPNATPSYRALGDSGGQVWMAQQAKGYGVTQLYGDAWSAPGFMKTNGTENNGGAVCGTPSASCSSGDWRQAYANYLTQYARDYANAGIPLTEIGAFNEPDYTTTYSSMSMNPTQTADMIRFLKPTLSAAGLNPKVVCCDPTGWPQAQNYASGVASNSAASANVDLFSSHGYSGAPNSPLSAAGGKHVWETEWSTFEGLDNNWDDGSAASGFTWAQHISTGLTSANLNAFLYWWGAIGSGTNDNEGLLQMNGSSVTTSGRLWAFANYSRFIRPGAVRIGANSGDSNLQVSAYRNTNGTVSVVVLNSASSAITSSYTLQNLNVANGTTVTPYLTNNSSHTAQQATTSVSGGSFSATIPARSLVTYVLSGTSVVTPTPTSTGTPVINSAGYAVNAGGAATGSFLADAYYNGGSTYSTTSTIDTSGVTSPAPQAVYQTERYGNFTYTLPGLKAGTPYTVRLHESENYWTSSGQRTFNVSINGQQVLSNFDIYAAAGGANKAVVEAFPATADTNGQITLQFTSVQDNAKVDGIEILAGSSSTPTPTPTPAATPTSTPPATPTSTPTATTGSSCSVQYAITNQWQGGFGTSVTITNTGSTSINGWTLTWTFANGQTLTQIWNATETQTGGTVSATNVSYNGTLAPGGTVNFGFNGSWNGTNNAPTAFTLNSSPCSVV